MPEIGKPPDKPQFDRFRDAARELGCDESEERFREIVRKVAKAPPAKNTPHPRPKKSK